MIKKKKKKLQSTKLKCQIIYQTKQEFFVYIIYMAWYKEPSQTVRPTGATMDLQKEQGSHVSRELWPHCHVLSKQLRQALLMYRISSNLLSTNPRIAPTWVCGSHITIHMLCTMFVCPLYLIFLCAFLLLCSVY